MLALVLFALVGCGSKYKSPQHLEESQTTVSAPQVDLHTAVVMGDLEAIRQHIKIGSDIDVFEPTRASTPLITAAALGKTEAATILIDAGADLDYQNNDGSTALFTAAFFCNVEMVEILLEKGADKNLKNNTGQTAYDIANLPFEVVKGAYDAFQAELEPTGMKLDYNHIETARPKIAAMLK
jgi:ankyrin repeat protein